MLTTHEALSSWSAQADYLPRRTAETAGIRSPDGVIFYIGRMRRVGGG
jgi:hypothetical protein